MLIKLSINNVVITNTYANAGSTDTNESTTLKIDNIALEQEVAPEEIGALVNGIADIVKELITAEKKKNTNTTKRFHIVKTHDFPNGNNNILYYVWDRKTNSHYIKVGRSSADIMSPGYFKESITQHKYAHRVIAEYDCNNFRL